MMLSIHGKHRYRTWSNSLRRYSFLDPSFLKLTGNYKITDGEEM